MQTREFRQQLQVDTQVLEIWIESGWLKPGGDREAPVFTEIDVARARLIGELRDALGMNEEAIPVVLDLIDQIHGLRRLVRELLDRDPDRGPRAKPAPGRRVAAKRRRTQHR